MKPGVAAVMAWVLLTGGAVRADDLREQARQHFERGKAEFAAARYQQALDQFQAAYAQAPFPELLYNIARCQEELHQGAEAILTYEHYLAVSNATVEHAELARHIEQLRRQGQERPSPLAALPEAARPLPAEAPAHKRWKLWTALLVGVAGAVALSVGLGVGLGTGESGRSGSSFPPLTVPGVR